MFYICAGTSLVGCIIYLLLASGEEQSWAKTSANETIDTKPGIHPHSNIGIHPHYNNGYIDTEQSNGQVFGIHGTPSDTKVHKYVDSTAI